MSHRHFIDESGKTWQVWEVRPARVERRMRERRRAQLPFNGPERRGAGTERRQRSEQRIFLGEELAHGWLAFHTGLEKRRYAPIPEHWAEMTNEQLVRLCQEARPVKPGGPHFGPRGGGGGGGGGARQDGHDAGPDSPAPRAENHTAGERRRQGGSIASYRDRRSA